MKRATSASVAAATAAATQVHHQARIQELFSAGSMSTAAAAATTTMTATSTTTSTSTTTATIVSSCTDELDKQITTISSRLEPKGSPKISPGTGDDNKAKSTMSRLLAVDSDNYMLRKGAATAITAATNGAAAPSSTTSSSSSSSSSSLNGSTFVGANFGPTQSTILSRLSAVDQYHFWPYTRSILRREQPRNRIWLHGSTGHRDWHNTDLAVYPYWGSATHQVLAANIVPLLGHADNSGRSPTFAHG
ncbi:uncharacterized protein DDB_G0271670-like, partial [Temnothorax curvispinosus]|uniref:Uncharacterized protein DDB_G0271670-like n=1 Tax=Temnothorax curvispinosus TaxID=300111 RepID=A0A6J1QMD0_9HYME